MAIPPGTRLGPYEVVSAIGAGGMGGVYQAQDTKLGRRVAIKVLPEAFAHDPDRLARFQREAKTLAALNHPNIATMGLRETNDRAQDDSGRPFVDLQIQKNGSCISLVELPPDESPKDQHVILFAKDLRKAHEWLAGRGVLVEPIDTDSGGNRLFYFRDLEGNRIEVCVEAG